MTCEPTSSDSQVMENRICSQAVALWEKRQNTAHPQFQVLNTEVVMGFRNSPATPTQCSCTLNAHVHKKSLTTSFLLFNMSNCHVTVGKSEIMSSFLCLQFFVIFISCGLCFLHHTVTHLILENAFQTLCCALCRKINEMTQSNPINILTGRIITPLSWNS